MTEVMALDRDSVWRAFAQSGDPLYYLLYKAAGSDPDDEEEIDP